MSNTDNDPRHHVIPDEGWKWEKPLTNEELWQENARLRRQIEASDSSALQSEVERLRDELAGCEKLYQESWEAATTFGYEIYSLREQAKEQRKILHDVLPYIHDYAGSGIQDRELRNSCRDMVYKVKAVLEKYKQPQP